jgi:FkbM family methyltransferase
MVVDPADVLGRVLAVGGEWEPHVTLAFRRGLRAGDVCIDIGAHIGYYTLLGSKLVGPVGHVYAFEPSPSRYQALAANLVRNGLTNVTALNLAAGVGDGSAVLYEAPRMNTGNSGLSPRLLDSPVAGQAEDYGRVEVRVCAVDCVVPVEVFSRVRVIKVDVEGYEVEALRGLESILDVGAPIALIVEMSPQWSVEDPVSFVEGLCARYGLTPRRLANRYSLDGLFPGRIEAPVRVDRIPLERCDLLLTRGFRRRWTSLS